MRWQPYVTVAAVIERNNKFLLVEETINGKIYINQPAGHWEANESLCEAVEREVLEETGYKFMPSALIKVYQWSPDNEQDVTFLRFTFTGYISKPKISAPLDEKIIQTHWLSYEEVLNLETKHRSPQVTRSINDYLSGTRFPLNVLSTI